MASSVVADDSGKSLVEAVFNYTPSKPAAGVAGALYFLASLSLFIRVVNRRSWWGLCLPIGAIFMSAGFFIRIALDSVPNSLGVFIIQQLFIITTPAAFLAFNYILYGRFIVNCVSREYSWIRPERVARIFVASDITTFLIQAGGGGMQSSSNQSSVKAGVRILLIGLGLQTASYVLFIVLVWHAHRKIIRDGMTMGSEPWWKIIWILYFSSVFIMIRCIYRLIELAQGNGGYLLTHEIYFYVFDSLPLLIAISVYIPFWPSKYLIRNIDDEFKMEVA
jgi:hypothetical protein